MSSQYVKEKSDEKKNHPSENFIMLLRNAENIAKWNLISCSKNKNGTSGLPLSFCCKKKVPQAPSLFRFAVRSPEILTTQRPGTKPRQRPWRPATSFFRIMAPKKRGSKHRGLVANINWKVIAWNNRWNIAIIAGTYFDHFLVINTCHLRIPNSWSPCPEATSLTSGGKNQKNLNQQKKISINQ